MDESTLKSTLETLQKKIEELKGRIKETATLPEDVSAAERYKKAWLLQKSLAPEIGATYREMVKAVLQAGPLNEETLNRATRFLSKSTKWFELVHAYDDLAENSLILARMQEIEGHYEWAEPTLRLAIWYAKYGEGKKAYYEDALKDLKKRRKMEKHASQQEKS